MKKVLTVTAIYVAVSMSGCASIVGKSQYPVTVSSTPSGATVVVKNKSGMEIHKAQTPTTVTLSSSAGFFSPAKYTLEFKKDGYQPTTASMNGSVSGWYLGNIIFGGLIGMLIVDPATGAMWKLDDTVNSNLIQDLNTLNQ